MTNSGSTIIIGTGLAGYTLGREIRKLDPQCQLTFITADDGLSYSKPMLSTGFSKNKTADDLIMQDINTLEESLQAEIITHTRVTGLSPESNTIKFGEEVRAYDKLVLAVGSICIPITFPGNAHDDVISVNSLEDYRVFRQRLAGKKHVFLIGAGLIGCEYANDLSNGRFTVECVDTQGGVLSGLLPNSAALAVRKALENTCGVSFHFNTSVARIDKLDDKFKVTLSNGTHVVTDIVLSAVGVIANTALAKASGLSTKRGITVNRLLQTSATNIYALGDCAEVDGHLLYYVMPLMTCARALAKTITGTPTKVSYGPMAVGIKTPACPVQTVPVPHRSNGTWSISGDAQNVKALFKNDADELIGFALTGSQVSEKSALLRSLPPVLA